MLQQFIPNIQLVSDINLVDPEGTPYRATKWSYDDHLIEVNIDQYGYHARIDHGPSAVNMDRHGFVSWVLNTLGRNGG